MQPLNKKIRGLLQENYPLAKLTSWRIGGPAQYFYQPADLSDLATFLATWKNEPIFFLGAGTNVLIRDPGIHGLVIHTRDKLDEIETIDDTTFRAEAGVSLQKFLHACVELGMVEATFLSGIPGTIGGALAMNAGAYGNSIWQYVTAVETINRHGEIKLRLPGEFNISYRQVSGFANEWFVAAHLSFTRNDPEVAKQKMMELLAKRRATQPLSEPNAGSVFRNPEGDYAARLIEACGLKGCRLGDAEVSRKHANFIVNKGQAKAKDIENLLQFVADKVFAQHDIMLLPEIHFLGDP